VQAVESSLPRHHINITVADRNDYHDFFALLYQVVTAKLEAKKFPLF